MPEIEIKDPKKKPILLVGEEFTVPEATMDETKVVEPEPDDRMTAPIVNEESIKSYDQKDIINRNILVNYILFYEKDLGTVSNNPNYVGVLKTVAGHNNRRERIKQDILTGKGKSYNDEKKAIVSVRENIFKILLKFMTDYKGNWGIVNVISSHSAGSSAGGRSPHADGRAVDVVGCDIKGIPDPRETDKLRDFVLSHIRTNKKEYACVSCLWREHNHNENNKADMSGMHMHLAVA